MTRPRRQPAFTLLELLVVITLMSVAVGMAVFRLDGLTIRGRLQAATSQMDSVVRLTQTQARLTGTPRRIEYQIGGDRIHTYAPKFQEQRWQWSGSVPYHTATGVKIERVLIEGSTPSKTSPLRIGPDGRYRRHAVLMHIHNHWAVMVLGSNEPMQWVLLDHGPGATSFDLLMLELAHAQD